MAGKEQKQKKANKHASNLRRRDRKYRTHKVPLDPITGRKIKYQNWKRKASQGVCGSSFCECWKWK